MNSCAVCGGLVGGAGHWCHCTNPTPNDYPHVKGFAEVKSTLGDLGKSQPLQITVTPTEFVHWLRGYFAAGGPHTLMQGDWKRIAEELAKVKT